MSDKSKKDKPSQADEVVDYKEAYLRALADYQNLQRESSQQKTEYARYANEELLKDLLPVVEHFHQGLKYIPEEYQKADWMVGFSQIKKMLDEFLQKQGIERIETVGQPFDPNLHEAVGNRHEDGTKPGIILEEVSGGYKLNGKLVQPPRVIVSE